MIFQLSGKLVLILEGTPEQRILLEKGAFVVVPRGVWHTADVEEPGDALFITPAEGTEHKAR